jgi:tyrosine-protein phosphatase SIW14
MPPGIIGPTLFSSVNSLSFASRAVAVWLFATSLQTASPQSSLAAQSDHVPARRVTVVGISNFAAVTSRLYRGGQPKGSAYEKLKEMGVDMVVDLRLSGKAWEEQRVTKAGMKFVALPWHCLRPSDKIFARFLTLLRDNPDKKIFVHCRYGDDRTGMMIAAYRMAVQHWSWQEARQEMNQFGFHHLVCAPLLRYEKSFPERLKKDGAFEEWRPGTAGSSR